MNASRLQKTELHRPDEVAAASMQAIDSLPIRHAALAIRPIAACIIAALVAGHVPMAVAATLPVTSCADDGSGGTLRNVVSNAVSGDTVDLSQLSCSTITLQNGQIEVGVNDLTLAGPGRDLLQIDGHDTSRILFHSGTGTLTVNGLTLTGGRADSSVPSNPPVWESAGGCVLSTARFAGITMTDAVVTKCAAIDGTDTVYAATGGGIYAVGPITLTNVIVSNNTASDISSATGSAAGGGIMNKISSITLTDSIVQGNVAEATNLAMAGGIFGYLSKVKLTNSVIDGNFAGCDTATTYCGYAYGGGVATFGYGCSLNTSSSTISNNTVSASGKVTGGGIALIANAPHNFRDGTQINGNRALSTTGQAKGGGAYIKGGLGVRDSTISGNSAAGGIGGGVFIYYGGLFVENSTVSGNSAGNAGAIYNAHAVGYYGSNTPVGLRNSTITANTATASSASGGVTGGVLDTQTAYTWGSFQSSIVAGNTAPNADPSKADLIAFGGAVGGANNLIRAAQGVALPADTINADPLLGPLWDNGGPTRTHALLFGSPALDAGNNSMNYASDQRGDGFARAVGVAADIGAYEAQQAPVPPPIVTKAFEPATIARYATSALTITLTNSNSNAATLTSDLIDTLPEPVVVADPANAATTCPDGTILADPGTGSVVLGSGAGLPAGGSCMITVSVTSDATGRFTNTIPVGALQTDIGYNVVDATADLMVLNNPPVAADDSYKTTANATLLVDTPGVLANDSDPDGDPLTAVLVAAPESGALSLSADGGFVYTPAKGFVGSDSFTYEASDGYAESDVATVTITVTQGMNEMIFADGFDGP